MNLCVRAAVALSILLFVPGLAESFENPKAAAVRVFGLAAIALAATSRPLRRIAWTPLDVAVAIWLATELLSTLFSSAPALSFFGEPIQREGFTTSLAMAGLYAAARLGARSRDDAERTLDVVMAAGAVASAIALLQAAGLDPFHGTPRIVAGAPLAAGRPGGTLGYPTVLAVVTAACAAAGWMRSAASSGWGRIAYALVAILGTGGTLCTLSRAGVLGLAAGLVAGVALLIAAQPQRRLGWRSVGIAAAVLVLLVAAALATGWGGRLADRFAALLHPASGSAASRLEIWRSAFAAWRERPLLGWGPDTFAAIFRRFQTAAYWRYEWSAVPFHAHSIYLQTLATRGVLGFAAAATWCVMLVVAAVAAWRRAPEERALIATAFALLLALMAAGAFGALGIAGQVLLVVASGLLAARAAPAEPAPASRTGRVAAWIVAGLALLWGYADLAASADELEYQHWLARIGEPMDPASRDAAQRAIAAAAREARRMPFEDRGVMMHSTALLAAADVLPPREPLIAATAEARRALRLVPVRCANHLALGRVLATRAALGDFASRAEARDELERVVRLAPSDAIFVGECARMSLILGDTDRAFNYATFAVGTYPDDGASRAMLARALERKGDPVAAAQEFARALGGEWHGDAAARDEAAADLRRLSLARR